MNHCIILSVGSSIHPRYLGPHRIAHWLRQHGWDAEVVDWASAWTLEQLQHLFDSRYSVNTRFIATSHLFSYWPAVMEQFCAWVKSRYPHVTIISGSATKPLFETQHIDYYIQGYGEQAILVLLKYLFGNGERPRFQILNSGGKKIIPANDFYPAFPMRDCVVKYEHRDFVAPGEVLGIEFARGCKFECAYCNFPVLGVKGDYTRDAKDFQEQVMHAYDNWGVTSYFVADETFNDRTEKITKFADVVETLPFQPWFHGYLRADLMISRKNEREELLRMNFLGHYYGIETFNHRTGQLIGKGMHPDRLKQGLIDTEKYFTTHGRQLYRGQITLITGLPEESAEQIEQSHQWLLTHWQQQSANAHPLFLMSHELEKKSLMDRDYEKWGYKKKTDAVVRQSATAKSFFNSVDWTSPNMDFDKAEELAASITNSVQEHFRLSPWDLGVPELAKFDMADRLRIMVKDLRSIRNNNKGLVDSYIDKKLSV